MGNKPSSPLQPVVEAIRAGQKVTFFLGAGVSTSAGIPDFRSPETGLYSNLSKLNLPYAEAVFDIDYFQENPRAFYTLAEELYPGKFDPTPFHYFVRLLQDKGLLHRVYTQNIDTLEREAGIEEDNVVEAHGLFAYNHCIECEEEMDTLTLKGFMAASKIPRCQLCQGLVKPDIVFFGEGLPERFFLQWEEDQDDVEIAIVAGTSLSVFPFALLPSQVPKKSLRLLVNREAVGDFTTWKKRRSDILALDSCDKVAFELAESLGWKEDLEALMKEVKKTEAEREKVGEDVKSEIVTEKVRKELEEEILGVIKTEVDETKIEDTTENKKQETQNDAEDNLEKELNKLKIY